MNTNNKNLMLNILKYNNIPPINNEIYQKLLTITYLWNHKIYSNKVKKIMDNIEEELKIFNKDSKYEFNFNLDYNSNLNKYVIRHMLVTLRYDNIIFIMNNNNTKIICLYTCVMCNYSIDENNIFYNSGFNKGCIFVNNNVCCCCIFDALEHDSYLKYKLFEKKNKLSIVFQIYVSKELSNYLSTIIFEGYILGLPNNIKLENIKTLKSNSNSDNINKNYFSDSEL